MTTRRALLALAAAALLPGASRAQAPAEALRFSALRPGAALPDWLVPQQFEKIPRHTEFTLVEDEGKTVLRARADASASGLARALRVDPRTHPLLAWRWKVLNLPARGDLATRAGDDYAARLYVTFDLDPSSLPLGERISLSIARAVWGARLPLAALCYVWETRAPVGTFAPNAYTDRVRMVVAESGTRHLGRWVAHERNVAEDYRRAFGAEPPAINGVVVSADTDNTGERTESYFGDAEFRPLPPS